MGKTSIAWADATWNCVRGCTKVSAGCKNCYAATFAERWRGVPGHPYEQGFDVRMVPEKLEEPLRWRKPRRIFVNSMSDLFHPDVPDSFILRVFDIMRQCHWHTFQVLTKRPERMADLCQRMRYDNRGSGLMYLADGYEDRGYRLMGGSGCTGMGWVHLGVSVEDQATAGERIPLLLATPAAVRFVSYEPALGPVDFGESLYAVASGPWTVDHQPGRNVTNRGIDWLIIGAESGPGARPMDLAWARSVVAQCKAASVPVFVKQLSNPTSARHPLKEFIYFPPDLRFRQFPKGTP